MKILWVKTDFLHPTNRGGQIRSLETLRHLHKGNEVHYVAYDDPSKPEGVRRANEYSSFAYPVNRPIPPRGSARFLGQLARNLFSPLPLAVGRYASSEMREQIQVLLAQHRFDSVVCDFLSVAPNIPDLSRSVLFQHNVETVIWRRHAEHAPSLARRAYFRFQAKRMFRCERNVCRQAAQIIAVSNNDADQMREMFGVTRVSPVATGVDLEYFARPADRPRKKEAIVFVGAMDWLPNIDGARWFVSEVLPLIRAKRPGARLILAGRAPVSEIQALAADPLIEVTGTVPDVRPYLWDAALSIVPLRIGGGTRLKIYEAMAAGAPVVSTTVGAEGLAVTNGRNVALADTAEAFAAQCVELLASPEQAESIADSALGLVTEHFSWTRVGRDFESILRSACTA